MNKILTIIVPCFNMECFLDRCCRSLIIDDVKLLNSLEVLLINDGSTDATREKAHLWESKYPGVIRVIDKRNGHYGSCINVGLREATGRYTKILDADDTYDTPEFEGLLRLLMNLSEHRPPIDMVVSDFVSVNDVGEILQYNRIRKTKPNSVLNIGDIPAHYTYFMHALTYRTDMLKELNYVQTEGIMYTDSEWACYPMQGVHCLYYYPHPIYRYYVGRPGASMDPSVLAKTISHRVQIYVKMVRAALKQTNKDFAYRLMSFAKMKFRLLYFDKVLVLPLDELNCSVEMVDNLVKQYGPDVYEFVGTIRPYMYPPFCYPIKHWRRKGCFSRITFVLIDMRIKAEVFIQRLMKYV